MRKLLLFLLLLVLLFFLYCFFVRKGGCCFGNTVSPADTTTKTVAHWINWNLMFVPGSLHTSDTAIGDLEHYLDSFAKSYNSTAVATYHLQYCPCDSLLTNLDATLVYGAGNSVPIPPTQPRPIPNGDYFLGKNLNAYIPSYLDSNQFNFKALPIDSSILIVGKNPIVGTNSSKSQSKVLAVIDTGLDTALFKKTYPFVIWSGNLLWQENAPKQTLFDVVLNESNGTLMDGNPLLTNNSVKHGTSVTEIILSQINKLDKNKIPQIMSIRAFDDSERGSIYTVSCALSYAIKHKVDYVNASWGYFGQEDSVLKGYIKKASESSIRVIASAGNSPGYHNQGKVCSSSSGSANIANCLDSLKKVDTLFYPASFAPDFKNLVSVTQLDQISPPLAKLKLIPCYFQNYSSYYITVGALEPPNALFTCCTFNIPFLNQPVEGSSFATPAMTALFMAKFDVDMDIKPWIKLHAQQTPGSPFTNFGSYFKFSRKP
jgi:Subtilase family